MRILTRLLFCLLFYSNATALMAQTDKPATASITGRITFDKQPLPGVTVVLESSGMSNPLQSSQRRPVSAKTDSEGRYRLVGITAGQYLVSPRALAYVLPVEGMTGRTGKNINLNDGEQIENLDFTLVKGGVIEGKITDHQDRPVIAQRVNLRRIVGASNTASVPFSTSNFYMFETDDRGVYRLFGLQAGSYVLSVGEGGEQGTISLGRTGKFYQRIFYPDARTEKEAKVIEVTEGSESTGIDIKLPKPEKSYEARGRVIDSSSAPVVGMTLMYRPLGNDPTFMGAMNFTQERTNAQGEFVLQGLLPGKYGVTMQSLDGASEYYSDPITFEVLSSDVEGLELKATRGASVSGVIVVEGINDPAILKRVVDVRANIYSATPPAPSSVQMPTFSGPQQTNPDGTFRVTGLRPGSARISASVMGGTSPLMLGRVERDGVELSGSIDIAAGEQITGIKIVMLYGASVIRGQVNVVGGVLPADWQLIVGVRRVSGPQSSGRSSQVDTRGKFVIEGLVPGEYELTLSPFMRTGMTPGMMARSVRQRATVGVGETPVTLTLDLSEKKEGEK